MKYRKASEIFPDELLKEIQKYSSGELVYIPKAQKRRNWGYDSCAKAFYVQRNEEIRNKYFHGKISMERLAGEYHLSIETIRKIIYK